MKFSSCYVICGSNFSLGLIAFFKQKNRIQLYALQTERVAVTFEVNIDESDCEHIQLWQQTSQLQQHRNTITLTLLILTTKLMEIHHIEIDVQGNNFRHLSPCPAVLTSGLPMEQLSLSLPVLDKRTSKIFLFSDHECYVSTDISVSSQSRQVSFGKYAVMSDLGQINKLAGRYDDKLYCSVAICTNSISSILLIYEDKRNSLFVAQWCKCVDSSKQIRIQWMQNFSSDLITTVSCEDVHGFGDLACIACGQYLWLVSEAGVVMKVATGISSTAPISALMVVPVPRNGEKEDYSSSSSSHTVTLQLIASAVNGEYYNIRLRGEIESSTADNASTVIPTVRVTGTKISVLAVSPVFSRSGKNRLHYHTMFLPFCRSMHLAMYEQSSLRFAGYHASFGVQFLQLSKSAAEPRKRRCLTCSPLDQITNISHCTTLHKDGSPLHRFVFSANDAVSGKSVLYKACEGISLLPQYSYTVEASPDLTYFHIPSFLFPSSSTSSLSSSTVMTASVVHDSLLLLSSKTNRSSSLHISSYHSDSDSHVFSPIPTTNSTIIREDEATVGFFAISSRQGPSLLQVTEKNIVLIKALNNSLVMDRSESFSSLFVHLDKSKKTLDLAATFAVQFYCYVDSFLYVASRDSVLAIHVIQQPSAPTSFRLLNVTSTKFSISGLAAADVAEGNFIKCICVSYWNSTTMDLHTIGDKGQFQQSCSIELGKSSSGMIPVFRFVCIIPILVEGDDHSCDLIAASADGTIKAVRVVHRNSTSPRRFDHGDVITVADLPGIHSMSVVKNTCKGIAAAGQGCCSPIVMVNGVETDYILQLSTSSTIAHPSYSCTQFTQPRGQVQRRCLNLFPRASVIFQQHIPDAPSGDGENDIIEFMCMWVESSAAGLLSLCMGFIDMQSEVSLTCENTMLCGALCLEHVSTIDGIVESMSLSTHKDIITLWCRPSASTGFNGWLVIIDSASLQVVWRKDIAISTRTSPTDVWLLKALECYSVCRAESSVEICWVHAEVFGAIAANSCLSMKSVVVTASMASHSLSSNRETSCHTMDRMEIPLQLTNNSVVGSTPGVDSHHREDIQRQRYLGAGDVHSAMLSRDVLLLILPDRRVVAVAVGFHCDEIDGHPKSTKLALLAELQVEWKSSAVTACHCLLDKFAIIAVHGLGLVIVEYNDKEYSEKNLKFICSVSLSGTPIRCIACRISSSVHVEYLSEPVYNVQIVCSNSTSDVVILVYARLPLEDCKLDPAIYNPVIHKMEFQREVDFDGLLQVIPLSSSSSNYSKNKDDWDFLCVSSKLEVLYFRPKLV